MPITLASEPQLSNIIKEIATPEDPAHDYLHFSRVVSMAKRLCEAEEAVAEVVVPAAWLHDVVIVPKSDPRRSIASQLSADKAIEILTEIGYPEQYYEGIAHAIAAHSFSAGIKAETLEAKIVQDADRLDGLGAIGIARCFATAGIMKSVFYSEVDPFCESREPVDKVYTLDHFYKKLFKTAETLQTDAGKVEGQKRLHIMKEYLSNFSNEI